jgi:hypothetical protein
MKKAILATAAMLVCSAVSYADIPRPTTSPTPQTEKLVEVNLDIRLDAEAKDAKLLIPKSRIKELRAQIDQLDDDTGNTAALTANSWSRTQTIVSGTFLSLAIVFGGMWFVRSGKAASKGTKIAVVTIGVGAIAAAASFVYANAGPPAEARSITGKMFTQAVHIYGFGYGRVKLGVTDGDNIRLIVPDPKEDKPAGEE